MNFGFVRALRNKVSGDKKRYNTGVFDLDLTYITDRIVAMAFPAAGMESTYRNDINEVSDMLTSEHNGKYRIFNLTERLYDYSKFQWRVATVGWPDHNPPPLVLLFKIVEEIHLWLLADPQNVVVVHCLAGKGRTGTVIGSYLLYSGLFNRLEDAERYFAIKRSVNNWGVTGPSQQRYTEFFWKTLSTKQRPNSRPLLFKSITFLGMPQMTIGASGKKGFTPFVTINDATTALQPRQLWQTRSDNLKTMIADRDFKLTIDLEPQICVIQGDVYVSIEHYLSLAGITTKQKVGRFNFNSAMIGDSLCLNLTKNDIDDANNDKRVPVDFTVIMLFETLDNNKFNRDQGPNPPLETDEFWERIFNRPVSDCGATCFWQNADLEKNIQQARAIANSRMGVTVERGGYLTKKGHKVKNWKRRWFVLHPESLEYYEKPKDVTPRGTIRLDDVQTVRELDSTECELPNSFIIITNWDDYICSADNDGDREGWIEDLLLALHIRDLKKQGLEYDPLSIQPVKPDSAAAAASGDAIMQSFAPQTSSSSPSYSPYSVSLSSSSLESTAFSPPLLQDGTSSFAPPDYHQSFSDAAIAAAAAARASGDAETLGQLIVQPIRAENFVIPGKVAGYCTLQYGPQKFKATFTPNTNEFAYKQVYFDIFRRSKLDQLVVQLWEEHTLLPDEISGEVRINLDGLTDMAARGVPVELEENYSFRKKNSQLADIRLKIAFKSQAMVIAERASKTLEARQTVEELRRAEQTGQSTPGALVRLNSSRKNLRESANPNSVASPITSPSLNDRRSPTPQQQTTTLSPDSSPIMSASTPPRSPSPSPSPAPSAPAPAPAPASASAPAPDNAVIAGVMPPSNYSATASFIQSIQVPPTTSQAPQQKSTAEMIAAGMAQLALAMQAKQQQQQQSQPQTPSK